MKRGLLHFYCAAALFGVFILLCLFCNVSVSIMDIRLPQGFIYEDLQTPLGRGEFSAENIFFREFSH